MLALYVICTLQRGAEVVQVPAGWSLNYAAMAMQIQGP